MSSTDKNYVQVPLDDFRHALNIISEFTRLLKTEIQDKHNLLLMSSGFEDLSAAYGMLAAHDPDLGAGLAVSNPDTRVRLRQAYSNVSAITPNTADGSVAQAACTQLQAALFSILNMCYHREVPAQQALENTLAAAGFAQELVMGLMEAGTESLEPDYLAKDGQVFTDARLDMLLDLCRDLRPSQDTDQADGQDPASGTGQESGD